MNAARYPQQGAIKLKKAVSFCSADKPFQRVPLRRIFNGLLFRKPLEIFIFCTKVNLRTKYRSFAFDTKLHDDAIFVVI